MLEKEAFMKKTLSKVFGVKKPKGGPSFNSREKAYSAPKNGETKIYDTKEMRDQAFKNMKENGFGFASLGTSALGMVPKVGKRWKDNAENFLTKSKIGMQEFDSNVTGKVKNALGVKPGGMIDNFTSTVHKVPVGKQMGSDGKMQDMFVEKRVSSMKAPIDHTMKFALPMAGSAYMFDKLTEMQEGQDGMYEQYPIQQSDFPPPYNPNQSFDERTASALETGLIKEATMEKISSLEHEVDSLKGLIKVAKYEREILYDDSLRFQDASEYYKEAYEKAQNELEKVSSEFEEYKESLAKEARQEKVTKVAENLLERGIIKQAKFNEYLDVLSNCDAQTFEAFSKLAFLDNDEKGLEKNLYMIDYIDKHSSTINPNTLGAMTKSGDTIADAVRDLLNK